MKINFAKINSFGKLKDKNIEFEDGINIIYGENETGKSTIIKFINSILFGISKNKNGKRISDFDKYSPWENSEFSGKLGYSIGDKKYEVFREFRKRNPIIYDENGNDISSEFLIVKSKEMDFMEAQIGVNYITFLNTAMIEQKDMKINKLETNLIVQKISNLVSTGDDNISFKKTMENLSKMQTEYVGSSKTRNRPINNVEVEIKKLMCEKDDLENYKSYIKNNFIETETFTDELSKLEKNKEFFKVFSKYKNEVKIREVELDFERKSEQEYIDQLNNIKDKMTTAKLNKTHRSKMMRNIRYILAIVFLIAMIGAFIFLEKKIFSVIPGTLGLIDVIWILKCIFTDKSKNTEKLQDLEKEYKHISLLYNDKVIKREEKEREIDEQNQIELDEILSKYSERMDEEFFTTQIDMTSEELEKYLDEIENEIKEISIHLHELNSRRGEADAKLERLASVEEELETQYQVKEDLISLNTSFNIAQECLESAYNTIRKNLSPTFEKKLCDITEKITNGKYDHVVLNDENDLLVEIGNGNYVPVDTLSIGTIDQMYFALRLSILPEITNEKLPIILDESFVYFDDNRLRNIISYLYKNNSDTQILIFTCSNREEKILKELGINYNLIKLEK